MLTFDNWFILKALFAYDPKLSIGFQGIQHGQKGFRLQSTKGLPVNNVIDGAIQTIFENYTWEGLLDEVIGSIYGRDTINVSEKFLHAMQLFCPNVILWRSKPEETSLFDQLITLFGELDQYWIIQNGDSIPWYNSNIPEKLKIRCGNEDFMMEFFIDLYNAEISLSKAILLFKELKNIGYWPKEKGIKGEKDITIVFQEGHYSILNSGGDKYYIRKDGVLLEDEGKFKTYDDAKERLDELEKDVIRETSVYLEMDGEKKQ